MSRSYETLAKARRSGPIRSLSKGILQRQCDKCRRKKPLQRSLTNRYHPAVAPPVVHDVLRSPGKDLDGTTQIFMERRFGHNFSHVRVHTGDLAAQSAEAVSSTAYTVGNNIVFGAGQYNPSTSGGLKLLAHEIAHTIQQRSEPYDEVKLSPSSGPLEEEADRSAALAVLPESSLRVPIPVSMHSSGLLQRVEDIWPGEERSNYLAAYNDEASLREEYRIRCEGVRVLESLNQQPMSPSDNIKRLEKLIRLMPRFIRLREALNGEPNPRLDYYEYYRDQLEKAGLRADSFLGSERDETARAECELSRARLEEFLANQGRSMPGRLLRPRGALQTQPASPQIPGETPESGD